MDRKERIQSIKKRREEEDKEIMSLISSLTEEEKADFIMFLEEIIDKREKRERYIV